MEKSRLIIRIQEIIYYLRIQHYHEGGMRFRALLQDLQAEPDVWEAICAMLPRMLEALEALDMVLLGDLLEEALLPALKDIYLPGEPVVAGNYCLEYTSCGCLTAKYLPGNFYLHSNCNPMEEARILVSRCFDADKEHYAVWGCGLGYHVRRLYEAAEGAVSITVFDEGEEIFRLAREFGALADLPADRVICVADESGERFAGYLSEHANMRHTAGILMHLPSVKAIENSALKESILRFCMGWNGTVQLKEKLAVNFRKNEKHCTHNVDEIAGNIAGREAVVAAAGPSLDHSLTFLREAAGHKVILAVGTVWKKLLDLGIVPDYVVVMDAQARTYEQFAGITSREVPLIVDSTAYWEFAAGYGGQNTSLIKKIMRSLKGAQRRPGIACMRREGR